jgi:hypothetical protein
MITPGGTDLLAVFGDYPGLIEALKRRRISLKMVQLVLDERAGLPSGYTAKVECDPEKRNARQIGTVTLPLVLEALGVSLALVRRKPSRKAEYQLQSHATPDVTPLDALEKNLSAWGKKGAQIRSARMSPAQRRKAARHAVSVRWRKHRLAKRTERQKGPAL